MKQESIIISRKEYKELKRYKKIDKSLLQDIATGIKDILQGKIKEI